MMKHKTTLAAALGILLLVVMFSLLPFAPQDVTAAPNAVPTPLAISRVASVSPKLVTFFDAQVITSDTRACDDSTYWDKMDLQWTIDVSDVNTTTLTLEFNNTRATYPAGINAVASVVADADAMGEFNLFGVETCVLADVTNANTITVTAYGLMK